MPPPSSNPSLPTLATEPSDLPTMADLDQLQLQLETIDQTLAELNENPLSPPRPSP